MTETTEPLTEAQIGEIEARHGNRPLIGYLEAGIGSLRGGDDAIHLLTTDIPALIRDWRAMKARIEALTTDWCECGHSRDKHQFFSDHDECYECDQASPDLCCGWRPAPRPNENAALREQLAQAIEERDEARRWMEIT